MRPLPPRTGRRALCACLAALAVAPAAHAVPDAETARAERDALAAQERALERRIARDRGALAEERARLDRARERHAAALTAVERRLRALYASPDPSPVIEVIMGGDLGEAQARIDLLEALGRSDRAMVRGYRRSAEQLRAAEAETVRGTDDLVRERAGIAERLERAEAVVAEAEEREEREREAAADAAALPALGGGLTVSTQFGVPVATTAAGEEEDDAAADEDDTPERGLPADLLRGRGLPGAAPRDAATGDRIDTAPAPAGPDASRAHPGIGAVGPVANGGRLPARLPTFTAVAGWYGPGFTRARMASGEPYDPAAFSAASRTLRLGTMLRVAYGGHAVTVRVNDRGPYVKGRDLDLSQAAAAALGLPGVGTVTVQILPGYAQRA
ncbi:MAG: RlpA-like double-psi beta-barrel domain-containing protein [Thermoleophilia bacterium]